MSIITLVATCLWFLLVSSLTGANEANVNCLKSIKSQVEDPNGYLSSWQFGNKTAGYICKFSGVTCWHDDENRVLSIKLSGFGLKGEFPLGINRCSDLTGLDLYRNCFSGALPSNISSLIPSVTTLDLSNNQFSGEIPAALSNITFLNTLMLQQNQFTGRLPPELVSLGRLNKFSVADNLLTGPVPIFNEALKIGVESFANNPGLCGRPLEACVDRSGEMIRSGKIGAAVGAALFAPVGWFYFFLHRRMGKEGDKRAVGAALFAPVGASLGWFFLNGRKGKEEDKRHWIFHIGD